MFGIDKLRSNSIFLRLIIIMIVTLCIGFGSFIWGVVPLLKSELRTLVQTQLVALSDHIAQVVDGKVSHDLKQLYVMGRTFDPKAMSDKKVLAQWMKTQEGFARLFKYGLVIVNEKGEGIFSSSSDFPSRYLDVSGSMWFDELKTARDIVVSRPFVGFVNKEPIMILASAIRDEAGVFRGAVVIPKVLNRSGFMEYLYTYKLGKSGSFMVISPKDSLIVASTDHHEILKPIDPLTQNTLYQRALNRKFGAHVSYDHEGNEVVAAISEIPTIKWSVVVMMQGDEIHHPIQLLFKKIYLSAIVFVIGLSLLMAMIVLVIFKPLRKVAEEVKSFDITNGRIRRIQVRKEDNEVGDLVIGINRLIDRVNVHTTELKETNVALKDMVVNDSLTGVHNRRFFDEQVRQLWAEKTLMQQPFALIMLDIDYFKIYNDTYGHQAGDECLRLVAQRIKQTLKRQSDILCRYGGEEFVILPGGDMKQAKALAEQIRHDVSEMRLEHTGSSYNRVTISLGVSCRVPTVNETFELLIQLADAALYESKEKGRNCVTCKEVL